MISKKYKVVVVIMIIGILSVMGCSKKENNKKSNINENKEYVSNEIDKEDKENIDIEDEACTIVKWGMSGYYIPEEDEVQEINKILKEKGLNCKIEFVNVGSNIDDENIEQLDAIESENGKLDIINIGAWTNQTGAAGFAESGRFYCLDDYLISDEGKELYDSFDIIDWERSSVNGHAYTIPKVNYKYADLDVYISINEDYEQYFADFDGTYKSLNSIYESIGNEQLKIVYENFDSNVMVALLGYSSYNGMAYDNNTGELVPFYKILNFDDCFNGIVEDIKKGKSICTTNKTLISDEILACVYTGSINKERENGVDILLQKDVMISKCGFGNGINSKSDKVSLALTVLKTCYSDERIVSILCDTNEEEIESRNKLVKECETTIFTNFIFDGNTEELGMLSEYSSAVSILCSEIENQDENSVNLYENIMDEKYESLFNKFNEQLKE